MNNLQEQYKQLEIKLWEKNKVEEENKMLRRMSGLSLDILDNNDLDISSSGGGGGGGVFSTKTGELDVSRKSFVSHKSMMSHDELLEENVRLTQLLLDIGDMEELEKIRTGQKESKIDKSDKSSEKYVVAIEQLLGLEGDDNIDIMINNNNNASSSKKDAATIQQLQQKVTETEAELAEVTELKNAEIDVLRKQLGRAEQLRSATGQTTKGEKEDWNKEREGLREEMRRLNREISNLKENYRTRDSLNQEEEDDELTSRYKSPSNGGAAAQYTTTADYTTASSSSSSDEVSSLQSIISMMRQTIDQSNREKDLLEQRLLEEQDRSQMELQAFAKTLEGVDDLRKSAEIMSREIRRIKVKGYRPTRSDLLGSGAGTLDGVVRNFGELTAAVEASENMEEAIHLIESQNDAMEERRRMGVVVASSTKKDMESKLFRGGGGLFSLSEDQEGGFLSFWNVDTTTDGQQKKEEKKKKSKRKKKKDSGSVLSSFF
ncbi:hypothetical protein ACHAXR_002746 [Thalassiosira sp. AJA248-18]